MFRFAPRYPISVCALLAAVALLPACGSGGSTTTTPSGSIALSLSPGAATIQQGGSTQVTGTVIRTNFTADIAISVSGAPTGVSGTVTLAPINGGNTAQVTLAASSATPVGTYTLTVVASGTGVSAAQATFTLTIAAATPASFTVALGSPALSIVQGASGSSTIQLARTNFTGSIAFAADNLPAGATAAFSPPSTTDVTGSVLLTIPTSVAAGTYNLLIRGTASGLTDATAALALTVTPEPRTLAVATGNGQSAEAGVALANPIVARVTRVSDGTGVSGVTVSFAVTAGGGSLSVPSGVTGTDGRVSVSWTVGPVAGAQTMAVSSAGLVTVNASATATPEVRLLAFETGSGQTGNAGLPLAQPLVARVTRQRDGAGVTGVSVAFAVLTGGGSVNNATVATGTDGRASVQWTLGPIGPQSLQASSAGFTAVVATATALGPGLTGIVSMSAGDSHICALTATGTAYCWGSDGWGELGDPSETVNYSAVPRLVASGGQSWASISGGSSATCARTAAGNAWCWGEGSYGGLGNGGTSYSYTPTPVSQSGQLFGQLASGTYFHCGLTPANQTWCWGNNTYGQIGDNTNVQRNVPTQVSGGLSFAEIVGHPSGYAMCGRTAAGAAYCWGYNGDNELGDGTAVNRRVPTAVSGGNVFTALSGGAQHMCGQVAGGDWKCWGYNGYGELGDGTETNRSTPTAVQAGGRVFVQLALGSNHTCGRTAAGAVFCWGRNGSGELGTGNHIASDTPVPSAAGMLFTDIRAGDGFTCGLTAGGAVFCWGDNTWGQLGDDVVNSSSTPIRVPVPFGSSLRQR